MIPEYKKLVKNVIDSIDWNKIMYYHTTLNIQWQIEEENGNIIERIPTKTEIKDELIQLVKFAINKNLKVLDYGNWIIYWTNEKESEECINTIEIIFSLESYFAISESTENVDELNKKMIDAINKELYEEAAIIRDKIKKIVRNK